MSLNVQAVNINSIGRKPLFNAYNYNPEKFVQNSYAVKGDLQHPESRTNYGADDNRGMGVYYLA